MAVKTVKDIDLVVKLDTGDDIMTGQAIYKNRYISNVNLSVTPQQALDCANALMALQKHNIYEISQRETHDLSAV